MFQSLRGRLILLLVLLVIAATAAGTLMVGLFHQSATAQSAQAEAQVARACDAIAGTYRFYSAGWQGPARGLDDEALRRELTSVLRTALRDRTGIEGGIWQREKGSLAYSYPTYQGSGPKTDLPQAELARIHTLNQTALSQEREVSSRYDAATQILLLAACPLPGPIPNLSGWTMTRVVTFAGPAYRQLMAGLAVLLASVVAAAAVLTPLTVKWSRHVGQIETALKAHDVAELPRLAPTGERELDRIVMALNEAGQRLGTARDNADRLMRQVNAAQRMATIGRVAAGVAHEIRNPIAAMLLKAETAIAGDSDRKDQALKLILGQINKVDALLRRLLSATDPNRLRPETVSLREFLAARLAAHSDLANAKEVSLESRAYEDTASFDAEQMRSALDNLILNAIQASPARSRVSVTARRVDQDLVLSVHDEGPGPPAGIQEHLFEPFVTGRADGTGLGLWIVRGIASAHGGTARLGFSNLGTIFEIAIPWQRS
jgi:signal transduction histidine kinase